MNRLKFFTFLILSVVAKFALAQPSNIDTIGFAVRYPEAFLKPHIIAGYIQGTDTSAFTITDTTNYEFTWGGDSAPERDSLHRAVYEFPDTGRYSISLTVLEKSTATTFNYTRFIRVRPFVELNIPNVFTPNDDNINDLFTVFYDGITNLEITIFSKTGTKVFSQKSPTIVWDGRNSSGAEVSQGIYYYVLVSDDPLIKSHNGFIHLYKYDPNK